MTDYESTDDGEVVKLAFINHLKNFPTVYDGELGYDLKEAIQRYVEDYPEKTKELLIQLLQNLGESSTDEV